MKTHDVNTLLVRYRLLSLTLSLVIFLLTLLGCGVTRTVEKTVEKTTKSLTNTTRTFTRGFKLTDEDLLRKVGIINFENNSLQDTMEFQNIVKIMDKHLLHMKIMVTGEVFQHQRPISIQRFVML